MTDNPNNAPISIDGWLEPGPKNAQMIYVLYFLGFFFGGVPTIIGLVMAYLNRGKTAALTATHYTWLIRSFWIGMLYGFVSMLLMFVGIGFLLFFAIAIWMIIRLVKGLQLLSKNAAIPNPQSWLF